MRLIILTLFAAASVGATEAPPAGTPAQSVVLPSPGAQYTPCSGGYYPVFNPEGCPPDLLKVSDAIPTVVPGNCKDRIEQVRDVSGQPALDKAPAAPNEGYLINAVDMRVDGCAVMQMKGDVNDLRPLPQPMGPARLQPAR